MAGQAHPEELIRFNAATGKFEVGHDALATLSAHRGPVGVVAVCGRARQGKSYILNQLLGQSSGFRVAATHRPCTKGLWMWSAPVPRTAPDGSPYHMVLLDTEGIDAYDQTGQYSTQIFSLAVLLSSLFVYNQMGGIDEAALDRLSLVTEMTRHIRVRAQGGREASSNDWELGEFTPSFIWLLRDFYLQLEEDGVDLTPRDYLETALRPVGGSGPSVEAKNQIRASIKHLFPDRECFTLVRPVNDEKLLQRLETADSSELRPEFRAQLAALTKAIFQRGQPKRMGSMTLTGPMLAGITKAYVDAINNGAVPCISTAWQGVAEAECRRGAEAAEAAYSQSFNTGCGGELEQLNEEHRRCLEVAGAVYADIAVGDDRIKNAHRERWMSACESRFANFRDKRLAQAELACEQMLSAAQNRLHQMTRQGMSMDSISEEFNAFMSAYGNSSEAVGPTKWKRLEEFMKTSFSATLEDISKREKSKRAEVEEEGRKETAALKAKLTAAEQVIRNNTEVYQQQLHATLAQKDTEQREMAANLEAQLVGVRAEMANARAELARAQGQLNEKERRLIDAEHRCRALEQELESLGRMGSAGQEEIRAYRERAEKAERERLSAIEARNEAEARASQAQMAAKTEAARAAKAEAEAKAARAGLNEAAGDFNRRLGQWEAPSAGGAAARSPPPRGRSPQPDEFHSPMADAGLEQPNMGSPVPDMRSMTIPQMKDWLVKHGKEDLVSELAINRAKKADWVHAMEQHAR
mmetsp:Transcript_15229/g.39199  ORF Transcript_15229/g.39199 Transcript_15229/m.39199 type:complete len:753 (+) Transcript_15229:129-2387(+)